MHESPAQIELLRVRDTSPLLQGLSDGELHALASAGLVHQSPAGAFLFKQGDPAGLLYLVTSGSVLFYRVMPNGKRAMLDLARPGDAVGSQCLTRDTYFFTAQALEGSTSVVWDGQTLARLLQACPRVAANALRQAVARMFELSEMCSELIANTAEQRLASALLRLSRRLGERTLRGFIRITGLSEEEVGAMAGLSLFTTNRILGKWRRQRILRTGRRQITLLRQDQLESIAGKLPAQH
jgi:CRP/FNR family transcriptional regulator